MNEPLLRDNLTPEQTISRDLSIVAQRRADQDRPVQILMAVESGSRAWGFASPDSDYDVRFVYANQPEWYIERALYLSATRPDNLSMMSDDRNFDYAGWDLLKALTLLRKSNPSLLEWLQSPIRYAGSKVFFAEFQDLADRAWSPLASVYHYKSMAHTNFREYLQGETVRYKKYLYVLRPILAARYVFDHLEQPPLNFDQLVAASDHVLGPNVKGAIERLVEIKRNTAEVGEAPRDPVLHDFIEWLLIDLGQRIRHAQFGTRKKLPDTSEYAAFLHNWLSLTWGH
jgi:predicted nucleotidyltransferase